MKFMVTWSIREDKWLSILKLWSEMTPQQRADGSAGVKILVHRYREGDVATMFTAPLYQRDALEQEQQAQGHQDRVGLEHLLIGSAADQRGKQAAVDQSVAAERHRHADKHAGQGIDPSHHEE